MCTILTGVKYNIFQDPITKEDFEGKATVECVKCEQDEFLCRCDVVFDGDTESHERLVDSREMCDYE